MPQTAALIRPYVNIEFLNLADDTLSGFTEKINYPSQYAHEISKLINFFFVKFQFLVLKLDSLTHLPHQHNCFTLMNSDE